MRTSIKILLLVIAYTTCISYDTTRVRVKNPERGWHKWKGTGDVYQQNSPLNQNEINGLSNTIIFRIFHMRSFKGKSLDTAELNSIINDFQVVRNAKKKIIPKFAYDEDGCDAPLAIVRQQIPQLQSIFTQFQDIIMTVHAGFIGKWGEWHSSCNGLENNKVEIMDLLLNAVPSPIQVSIRYPGYKKEIVGATPTTRTDAFSFNKKGRIGHHNDCFLQDDHDSGTYEKNWGWGQQFFDQAKTYLASDSLYLINGGESCTSNDRSGPTNPARTNCNVARTELRRFHYTYLNDGYSLTDLKAFSNQGCYEEITDNLGYSLILESATLSTSTFNKNDQNFAMTLTMVINNLGYASPVFNRPVQLVLSQGATNYYLSFKNVNVRDWISGSITVPLTMTFSDISSELSKQGKSLANLSGTYTLSLRLPDKAVSLQSIPEYSIGFVNRGMYNPANGLNDLKLNLSVSGGTPTPTTKAPVATTKAPVATTKAPVTSNTCVGKWRYITISNNKGPLNIAEVQVFSGTTNLAIGKSATQSSTAYNLNAPLAIDGNANTYTHTGETDTSPWWRLDLGADYSLTKLTVANRLDCCRERLNSATVQLKNSCGTTRTLYLLADMTPVTGTSLTIPNTLEYDEEIEALKYRER